MLNPIKAYRAYRWRRRVEWFGAWADYCRRWRDSPSHVVRLPPELRREAGRRFPEDSWRAN